MYWLQTNWQLALGLCLTALGLWWVMPRRKRTSPLVGAPLLVAGLGTLSWATGFAVGPFGESMLFSMFAAAAIGCAILMITSRKPVYSALWFALATLSVCGLYVLQSAAFLAAATIIIYAGAIVVTFVFVIMLAQQDENEAYDIYARQPLMAIALAFFLLGGILTSIQKDGNATSAEPAVATTNLLSRPEADKSLNSVRELGRSVFGDYLYSVEIAGALLLIATIGAIALAPRRTKGTL